MNETFVKKIWPEYFREITNGNKKFELRRFDPMEPIPEPGDYFLLKEWDPETKEYTGRSVKVLITNCHHFCSHYIFSIHLHPEKWNILDPNAIVNKLWNDREAGA